MRPPHASAAVSKVLEQVPSELPADRRFVIAIAGPPAAGKSTLAAALIDAFGGSAGLVALDGFHFDDSILIERGDLPRKGAPHTFDVASYSMTLQSLRASPKSEQSVPVFDRTLELSRNCATIIAPNHQVLVTEGNYLLLDRSPWTQLRPLFDLTVWLDIATETIEGRIRQRWSTLGYPDSEITRRAEENDLPNARLVVEQSVEADLRYLCRP